jgi:hypothetical protein
MTKIPPVNTALAVQSHPIADWHGISSDGWTAIGTIALAGATLVTLLATIVLARLSDRHARLERTEALEAEQLAEAYAIQVIGSDTTAFIINHSKYTITDIDGRLKLRSGASKEFTSRTRFLDTHKVDKKLIDGIPVELAGTAPAVHSDILAPWDAGLRLQVDPVVEALAEKPVTLVGAYPVIRWTDRWDNRWEHELGHVTKFGAGDRPPAVSGVTARLGARVGSLSATVRDAVGRLPRLGLGVRQARRASSVSVRDSRSEVK